MGRQPFTNAISYLRGTFGTGVGEDECKLVATKPRGNVRFTSATPNHRRRFDQGAAAGLVPVVVVDALEPIEVEEQERQRTARTRRPLGLAAQHLVQVPRV